MLSGGQGGAFVMGRKLWRPAAQENKLFCACLMQEKEYWLFTFVNLQMTNDNYSLCKITF